VVPRSVALGFGMFRVEWQRVQRASSIETPRVRAGNSPIAGIESSTISWNGNSFAPRPTACIRPRSDASRGTTHASTGRA
jgi:hypothetical protein